MPALSNWLRWFDPRGRLSRGGYLRLIFRLMIISIAIMVGGVWLASMGIRLAGFIAVLGITAVWVSSLAQLARRLHDRNRSGYWDFASLLCTLASYGLEHSPWLNLYVLLAIGAFLLVFSLWLTVEILFRRGTVGPNRYGPDPRSDREANRALALNPTS